MKKSIKYSVKKVLYYIAKLFRIEVYFELPPVPGYVNMIDNLYGHKLTRETGMSIDVNKNPLPWFTYSAIEYLNQLNLQNLKIFEWGSGNSSLYFSKRASVVYSVENNPEWYNTVKNKAYGNNYIFLEKDKERYVNIIADFDILFDIIIIDGGEREECANICTQYLSGNGMIILDNSDRHFEIAKGLRLKNLLQIDMHGLGPIGSHAWTTSFFFKREINLIPILHQPMTPIGGGF